MTRWDRQRLKKKKNKKGRHRLCLSVYKEAPAAAVDESQRKQKLKSSFKKKMMEKIPNFYPNSSKPIAGELVFDNAIANCNKGPKVDANKIWGKKSGILERLLG
ncbi:hypothetical protein SLE2022_173990 [Rubroshorea leprosula]